jgi:hypothetical protein
MDWRHKSGGFGGYENIRRLASGLGPGEEPIGTNGEDLMKNARFLMAGVGVGLCLCALARADDDEIRTVVRPVVVKRLIVFTGHQDRVICVRPAYPVQTVVPVNRPYSGMERKGHRHSSEDPAVVDRDTSNSGAKTSKTSRGDVTQSDQKADKDNRPVDTDRKTEAKQSEDDDALDLLAAQAQREQELRLAEPGGIQRR